MLPRLCHSMLQRVTEKLAGDVVAKAPEVKKEVGVSQNSSWKATSLIYVSRK